MRTKVSPPSYQSSSSSWYNDSARYEYLQSDVFWTLAILILVNCWWSAKQVDFFDSTPEEQAKISPRPSVFWLRYRITSRLRQYLVFLLCTLVIPLHLLHGSWVLKSAWRITFGLVNRTYPSIKPRILGFVFYSPLTAVISLGWAVVLGLGVIIVGTQFLLVRNLWIMTPYDPSSTTPSMKITDSTVGDADWQEIKGSENDSKKDK
ncbi:hypothetical protein FPOAC2_06167 [Fusarium poae]|jgi:hypothetical protein|uniref:Uncharacterized protein n=1 Tax=Fusarium poae TaxID=36050 RepID=A0A1B8AX70_FUSPO|nr:hypothetical protein FPOAC1_006050 [Fusarium poae]KAG8672763.1 hypothetical protein FPOAC1_006050 [Fusarium poae]OBS24961.1 hypothetical protein FPOA_05497 [Fusarium poae]